MRQEQAQIVRQISGLSEISDGYDAILCDIWGVLHNGVASFAAASEALVSFRRRGGAVVLISNAPRPSPPVQRQVLKLGVPPEAFDAVVTSGDVTIGLMQRQAGDRVLHIGPERDLSLFDAAAEATGAGPRLVALEDADYALCTGLRNDETETPDDYEPELQAIAARGMTMICANPDIVIHRGDTLIYCAGALARRYEELGGSVDLCRQASCADLRPGVGAGERVRGAPIDKRRVLAIGDGMRTDIAGATRAGLDALFVTGGIHRSLHGETPRRRPIPSNCNGYMMKTKCGRSPPSPCFGRRRPGLFGVEIGERSRFSPVFGLLRMQNSLFQTLYFEDLAVGMRATIRKTVENEDVIGFAELSGDHNPIHLSEHFARKTRFGGRIVHGLYTASLISGVIGMRLPGPGAVYISQTLHFLGPVKIGDVVDVSVEVVELTEKNRRVRLHCECRVGDQVVLDGEGVLSVPPTPKTRPPSA